MRAPQGIIFELPGSKRTGERLASAQAGLDKETEDRLERLYTDGLSAFWVEDSDKACQSFQAILDQAPDYPNAAAKLQEAQCHRKLNGLYGEALTAEKGRDWQTGVSVLDALVAEAADFKDAATRLAAGRAAAVGLWRCVSRGHQS